MDLATNLKWKLLGILGCKIVLNLLLQLNFSISGEKKNHINLSLRSVQFHLFRFSTFAWTQHLYQGTPVVKGTLTFHS